MSRKSASHEDEARKAYSGRWVAKVGGKIVAQGGTPQQAHRAAKATRHKEKPEIEFVTAAQGMPLPRIIQDIQAQLAEGEEVYLVGGAVRDILLKRESADFDFAAAGGAIQLGRRIADKLGGDYYVLDEERDAGRVLLSSESGERITLDFVAMRGADIEADLSSRDFSINAMALELTAPEALLDPTNGAQDLHDKQLRACTRSSIADDPIRALRAIRMAAQFGLKIEAKTLSDIKTHVEGLGDSSAERLRDEIVRILQIPKLSKSMRALELIGALKIVLPELEALKGLEQSPPHAFGVWEHTLKTIEGLEKVLGLLDEDYPKEGASDLVGGLIVLQLGRYREQISARMAEVLVEGRQRRELLMFAALYHDAGKASTQSMDADRIRHPGHEEAGAELTRARMEALRFSRTEIDTVFEIVRGHKRPAEIARVMESPDQRQIYRFFREFGDSGVDICLLVLADIMGRHGHELSEDVLKKRLAILRPLLEGYFEEYDRLIAPEWLLNGDDLMAALELEAGPQIGELLEKVREAQVVGEIKSREEVLELAKSLLAN